MTGKDLRKIMKKNKLTCNQLEDDLGVARGYSWSLLKSKNLSPRIQEAVAKLQNKIAPDYGMSVPRDNKETGEWVELQQDPEKPLLIGYQIKTEVTVEMPDGVKVSFMGNPHDVIKKLKRKERMS